MTNQQIINIILAVIVGIVSAFSKSIFDKLFAEYKPDTKKIISRTKFFTLLVLRYLIPIIGLISLGIKEGEVDKTFVISFSFLIFVLVLNIFMDILFNYYDKKFNKERELIKPTLDIVEKLSDQQIKSNEATQRLISITENHIKLSKDIIETLKQKNNS